MIKGDIFITPIDFALDLALEKYANSDDSDSKFTYELLRRSKAMWENIRIHGLDVYGMTYEQFCNQFNDKKNIIFMSDDELKDFNKAVEIMKVMRS